MKSLKSLFISVYLMLIAATLALSFWLLSAGDRGGLALLVCSLPMAVFFAYLFLRRPARTPEEVPLVQWTVLGGLLAACGMLWVGKTEPWVPLVAFFNQMGMLAYFGWYSRYQERSGEKMTLGKPLPKLHFTDAEGNPVTLASFKGQPLVLLFFRGNWCPLCMAQVREIADQYRQLQARGVRVLLISPQSQAKTQALAARFDAPMDFLRDPDLAAARALGIVDAGGTPLGLEVFGYDSDTIMPTVLIVDGKGRLVYRHLTDNYRVRPEPGLFLQVLEEKGLLANG
ncbi:MAG: peroxiredoxin family protein [Alcanivorax sp.]|nr:peroxiredoxin family protein [Alcanivorax sp.]